MLSFADILPFVFDNGYWIGLLGAAFWAEGITRVRDNRLGSLGDFWVLDVFFPE